MSRPTLRVKKPPGLIKAEERKQKLDQWKQKQKQKDKQKITLEDIYEQNLLILETLEELTKPPKQGG